MITVDCSDALAIKDKLLVYVADKPYDNPVCVVQIKDWSKI